MSKKKLAQFLQYIRAERKEREEEKIEKIFIRNTWNFGSRGEEHIRITHRKRCRYYLFDCICKSG